MKHKYLIFFSSGIIFGALFKGLLILGAIVFVISILSYLYIKKLKIFKY